MYDEREKGFEKKFQMDEELQFKVAARSNKYLGEWASAKLGKNEEEEKNYIEKILRFTEISQCFTPPSFNNEISSLPAIKNNYITFGSFNNLSKINNKVITLWSKILKAIPKSKIFLKNNEFNRCNIT